MTPGIVFALIGIIGAATAPVLFRRAAAGSSRALVMPATPPLASWGGGLRTRVLSGGNGTARLELFDWGARVRTSGLFGWLGLRWEVRYSELVQARLITYSIANRGVLLSTDGSAPPLAFTTLHPARSATHPSTPATTLQPRPVARWSQRICNRLSYRETDRLPDPPAVAVYRQRAVSRRGVRTVPIFAWLTGRLAE